MYSLDEKHIQVWAFLLRCCCQAHKASKSHLLPQHEEVCCNMHFPLVWGGLHPPGQTWSHGHNFLQGHQGGAHTPALEGHPAGPGRCRLKQAGRVCAAFLLTTEVQGSPAQVEDRSVSGLPKLCSQVHCERACCSTSNL